MNLYTYCHNNPIVYHDPTGHNKKQSKVIYDGFVDENWNEYPYVQVGSKGKFSSESERLLYDLGYIEKRNGIYDAKDSYWVKLIQKKYNLRESGIVDNRTLAYLKAERDILNYSRTGRSKEEINKYTRNRLSYAG